MKISLDLEVPMVPGFLRIRLPNGESATIPIDELEDEKLRQIGALWVEKLVSTAQSKRKMAQSIR